MLTKITYTYFSLSPENLKLSLETWLIFLNGNIIYYSIISSVPAVYNRWPCTLRHSSHRFENKLQHRQTVIGNTMVWPLCKMELYHFTLYVRFLQKHTYNTHCKHTLYQTIFKSFKLEIMNHSVDK